MATISDGFAHFLGEAFAGDHAEAAAARETLDLLTPLEAGAEGSQGADRPAVYVLACFLESDRPVGGVKMLYRHVDVLGALGFRAAVVHRVPGFRCTWFENDTPVRYLTGRFVTRDDVVVVPEMFGPFLAEIARGARKVVYNQNCYATFQGYPLEPQPAASPYLDEEVIAALVVSEDSREYLRHAFPQLPVFRIHHSLDPALFAPGGEKRPQIAFMPRRRRGDLVQVLQILGLRGVLEDYELVAIEDRSEAEVAEILRRSAIFLSTGSAEGFGLPAAEAMACGCLVVGYHGGGGREFLRPDVAFPVTEGDVLGFARAVEEVIRLRAREPGRLEAVARRAAESIRPTYSPEAEAADVAAAWTAILGEEARR